MEKKYQVFVSSTFSDLVDERQDALKSILDMGHIAAGMEGFFAADEEQLTYIKKIIDECDYYILIVAGRYGSLDESGLSYTEREYEYAVEKGITVLAFIHNKLDNLFPDKVDVDDKILEKLNSFKSKVTNRRLVRFWNTREQLKSDIVISLLKSFSETPRIGWVRSDKVAAETVLQQLNAVRNEVDKLRDENAQLKGQLKPAVLDIAPLTDKFEIAYSYVRNKSYRTSGMVSLAWGDIFKIIGPRFFSPASPTHIDSLIDQYISRTTNSTAISLFPGVVDKIKIQMSAYKYLKIYSAVTTAGGQSEFVCLTEIGKQVLTELTISKAVVLDDKVV